MQSAFRWGAWGVSAAFALILLTQPVSTQAQFALSLSSIAALVGLWFMPKTSTTRFLFLALASFVALRYMFWRATSTLPPLSDPLGFGLGFVLLLAELYCLVILAVSLIINADPLVRKPLPRGLDEDLPTVDIFIPTYNEDDYILAATVSAARSLDYPADKFTVWLLDDGGSDQKCNDPNPVKAMAARKRRAHLQRLCHDLGARYHTRARNEHAKAGNMNAAFKVATGEIILVLDADHAPFRSFLRETIGHFAADPNLFLVQTPHVFLNPDPIERNLKSFDRMPSENEMFYSITQRGLDKWNGSFFCGSAALLRRSALDLAGGFSGITITEDCETAFELHGRGMTSVFVDKPLIAGLQPETFTEFISQRSRWCQGMFQIMMLKNPLFKSGLKPIQRLAYMSSMVFWFFPIPRLMFMFAPLLHIFFDVKIFVSNVDEAVAYTAFYMVVSVMLQNYLYGRFRWPWVSELYEYVQGVYLFKAIISVALKPRSPTFKVTAKGISLDRNQLSALAWPFFAIYGLLAAGGLTAAYRYMFEPGVTNLMLVVGLWNCFNMIIAGVALGVVAERKQDERHPRLGIKRKATLIVDGAEFAIDVDSVSVNGCGARMPAGSGKFAADKTRGRIIVTPLDGPASPCPKATLPVLVRHVTLGSSEIKLGLEFDGIETADYMALAELMYADAGQLERFLLGRRKHKNILEGSLRFIAWGVLEPLRAFSYVFLREPKAAASVNTAGVPVVLETPVSLQPVVFDAMAPFEEPATARAAVEHVTVEPVTVEPVPVEPAVLPQVAQLLEVVSQSNTAAAFAKSDTQEFAASAPQPTPMPVLVPLSAPSSASSPATDLQAVGDPPLGLPAAPHAPEPMVAPHAAPDLAGEWLKQLIDLANWELRNAPASGSRATSAAVPKQQTSIAKAA